MRSVRAATLAGLALLATLAAAGCAQIHGTRQVLNRADLVDDLASRLDRAGEQAYTARYQLAGGQTATIAQTPKPRRSAFTYPGGKVVIDRMATAVCDGQGPAATCTLTAPPLSTSGPPAHVLDAAVARGLVYPTVVMGLLTDAALDRDAEIDRSDATIAGQRATCVDVRRAATTPDFTACITTHGVLGSFAGTLHGRPTELSLVGYTATAPDSAFALPDAAKITDRRR